MASYSSVRKRQRKWKIIYQLLGRPHTQLVEKDPQIQLYIDGKYWQPDLSSTTWVEVVATPPALFVHWIWQKGPMSGLQGIHGPYIDWYPEQYIFFGPFPFLISQTRYWVKNTDPDVKWGNTILYRVLKFGWRVPINDARRFAIELYLLSKKYTGKQPSINTFTL